MEVEWIDENDEQIITLFIIKNGVETINSWDNDAIKEGKENLNFLVE